MKEELQELLSMEKRSRKSRLASAAALRMDSCLAGDEEAAAAAVLATINDGDLHLFTEIINGTSGGGYEFDVNAEIDDGKQGLATPLHLAVAAEKKEFVEILLRHADIDPNKPHRTGKKYPLHVAAETGQRGVLQLLLRCGADANAKMENGSTALHVAAARSAARWCADEERRPFVRGEMVACAKLLADEARPAVNIDAANTIGMTAVKLAADKGSPEMCSFLLDRGAFVDGETMDLLEEKHSSVIAKRDLSRNRRDRDTQENKLFFALYDNSQDEFMRKWKEAEANNNVKIDVNATDGRHTFLQLSCDKGMEEAARFLLESGADPNRCSDNLPTPPLVLAGHHGYHHLIRLFRDFAVKNGLDTVDFGAIDENKDENVLHKVLKAESKAYHNYRGRDYEKCLSLLLDHRQHAVQMMIQPAIDAQDNLGNTPLHVAAFTGKEDAIRRLLRCGANIGVRNLNGLTPIEGIDPALMEEFLDDCLVAEGAPDKQDFMLMFRYAFLGPPLRRKWRQEEKSRSKDDEEEGEEGDAFSRALPEAEPLWYLSQSPRHRHLLAHPVVSSFLYLKWRRIRPFYYVNLAFYLAFVAMLTTFLLLRATGEGSDAKRDALAFFKWGTLVFLVTLTLRELSQAFVSFWRYLLCLENLLELAMMCITYALILGDLGPDDSTTVRSLSGAALVLSWAEMVLLLGRHPKLSTFIAMFSAVSLNFFYFLTWYSSIIVAFGLTFFVVLQRPPPEQEGEEPTNGYFSTPVRALFKTTVMSLTGEIEFESIDFGGLFAALLFLAYVFFVMLVLVNLLNGLAVSDIAEIQKHAQIVSLVSRVELITSIESMLLGDPFGFLSNWPSTSYASSSSSAVHRRLPDGSCLNRGLYAISPVRKLVNAAIGRTLLFQRRLRRKTAVFAPNRTAYEDSLPGSAKDNLRLEQDILREATAVVVNKSKSSNDGDDDRLAAIEKALKLVAKQNNHIIEKLEAAEKK